MSGSENFLKPHQLFLPNCEPERGQSKEEVAVVAGVPALEVGRIKGKFTVRKYRESLEDWLERFGSEEGLERFHRDNKPYEVITAENVLCTSGINFLLKCSIELGVTPATSGTVTQAALNMLTRYSACVGVGDGGGSVPTPSASDTDVTASSNYNYVNSMATPTVSTNQISISASFGASLANFHWRELLVTNAAASVIGGSYPQFSQGLGQGTTAKLASNPGTSLYSCISHLGTDLGTKSTGSSWSCTWTCTVS